MSQEIVVNAEQILKLLPNARTGLVEVKDSCGQILGQYYLDRDNGTDKLYTIEGGLPTPDEMDKKPRNGKRYSTDEVLAQLEPLRKRVS